MLAHLVVFNFKVDLSKEKQDEILQRCKTDLPKLPGVQNLVVGKNVRQGSEYEYGLCMYFNDEAELDIYRNHPDHVHFRDVVFFPFLEKVQGFDFEE